MKAWNYLTLCVITSVMLMVVALYNGYPLVDADSAAYIEQAIYPHFTPERTPFYGFFMRAASMHRSLWFVVAVQSMLLSVLLLRYITFIQGTGTTHNSFSHTLLTTFIISAFTCVSWVTSFLMPDVFTAILLLALLLFMADKNATRLLSLLYAATIFVAITMHFSHIAIVWLMAGIFAVYAIYSHQKTLLKKSIALLVLCFGFWGIMGSANFIKKHGFVFARGSNVIMMGKLTETGILQDYLNKKCGTKNLTICHYKDQLPSSQQEFMESGESPLYKMGGWDSSATEYSAIITDVFTSAHFLGMFVQKSVIATLKQLTLIKPLAEITPFGKNSEPYKKVNAYFTDEAKEYATALQNAKTLKSDSSTFIYMLFFIFTSLWIIIHHKKVLTPHLRFTYCIVILFFIANAFVTATFASVASRFQYRIFWMLPATNAIIILMYYKKKLWVDDKTTDTGLL